MDIDEVWGGEVLPVGLLEVYGVCKPLVDTRHDT